MVSSIQQEASESVKVPVVVADETVLGQADIHLVPSCQFHGHNNGATVFTVTAIVLDKLSHHLVVYLQIGADEQGFHTKLIISVDGDSKAVDTRAGSGEDTGLLIVVVSQVDEAMFVGDDAVRG